MHKKSVKPYLKKLVLIQNKLINSIYHDAILKLPLTWLFHSVNTPYTVIMINNVSISNIEHNVYCIVNQDKCDSQWLQRVHVFCLLQWTVWNNCKWTHHCYRWPCDSYPGGAVLWPDCYTFCVYLYLKMS